MTAFHEVAALLGRPADELQELDRRPLVYAFAEGRHTQLVLRDRVSREVFEITVSADGRLVDVEALAARNRAVAAERASVLDDELSSLLLRHPELERLRVAVSHAAAARHQAAPRPVEAVLSAREVAELSGDPTVHRIVLLDDPVILDAR